MDESLSVLDGLFRIISVQQEWRRNFIPHCMWALIFASTVLMQPSVSLRSRTQAVVRCLSVSLRFSKQHIHVWKQRSWMEVFFFPPFSRKICSWAVCCASGIEAIEAVVIGQWMGNASWWQWGLWHFSQRSQRWRVAVTAKSWSHSSLRKREASLYIGEATSGIHFSNKTWQAVNYSALIQA